MTSKLDEQVIQDAAAENYELLRHKFPYAQTYHEWWLNEMLKHATTEHMRGTVLDNGCGIGVMLDKLDSAKFTVGLDLSYEMLRRSANRAATHVATRTAKITPLLVQGDSLSLPFAAETFDLIIARSLLHHLPQPQRGVDEMYRVLKPAGKLILADTNRSLLSTLPRRIAYRTQHFSDHHQNFERHEYLGWISIRFTINHLQYFGYLAYPFGFPDMMGKFNRIPFPTALVKLLIAFDRVLARLPVVQTQSWGLIVAASKP